MSLRWPLLVLLALCARAEANPLRNRPVLRRTEAKLAGQVLDYTRNHGSDNRIYCESLGRKWDLYVYLPPNYDPKQKYPLVYWLHGIAQDEVSFLKDVIVPLDRAITCGKLVPCIIVAPDGSTTGRACYSSVGSFFLNTKAGNFDDLLMKDVWDFVHSRFPIRPEREAHAIAGVSMGGGAAFNKAFKNRDRFKLVVGIFPPLNTRYESNRGRYLDDYEPGNWRLREDFSRTREPVARFLGVLTVRLGAITRELYGKAPDTAEQIAAENPLELLLRNEIKDGEFDLFVAYGGKDEFNIDAQVESFLEVAKGRGIGVTVAYQPNGRHDRATALKFLPALLDWLEPRLKNYGPTP